MRFRLGRIPVYVHFSHILISAGFAYLLFSEAADSPGWPGRFLKNPGSSQYLGTLAAYLFAWMAIVFLSVLIHELGHALVSLAFGYRPSIYLAWLGGHTNPNADEPIIWWRDVLLTLAGPFFGLLLGLAAFGAHHLMVTPLSFGDFFLNRLWAANVFWALLNLIPISPLDGGRISAALFMRALGRVGFLVAQIVGLIAAGLAIWWVSRSFQDPVFPAVLFATYAFRSLAVIAAYFRGEVPAGVALQKHPASQALGEATALFDRAELESSRRLAERALEGDLPVSLRSRFHRLLGWIALKEGRGRTALDHFAQVVGAPVEPEALAAGFSLVGDDARALGLWQTALRKKASPTVAHELAACLLRLGREDEARRVPGVEASTAYRFAAQVLFTRGAYSEAARLGQVGLQLRPDPESAYEAACALARAGDTAGAVRLLNRATDLGFSDFDYAQTDADLAAVHALTSFSAWVARVKNQLSLTKP